MSTSPTSKNASFAFLEAESTLVATTRIGRLGISLGTTVQPNAEETNLGDGSEGNNAIFVPPNAPLNIAWRFSTRTGEITQENGTTGLGFFLFRDNSDGGGTGANRVGFWNLTNAAEVSYVFGSDAFFTPRASGNMTIPASGLQQPGTYKLVPVFWSINDTSVEDNITPPSTGNVSNSTNEFYIDADNNVLAAGGAAPPPTPCFGQMNIGRVAWIRVMGSPESVASSVPGNQGYTQTPTLTVDVASGVLNNPKQVRVTVIEPGQPTTASGVKIRSVTPNSTGVATTLSYNVNTQFPRPATNHVVRLYTGPRGGSGATPTVELPDLLTTGTLVIPNANDRAWLVFYGSGSVGRAIDSYSFQFESGLSIGHDVLLNRVDLQPTGVASSGTSLYNRGEGISGVFRFDNVFSQSITPANTSLRVHAADEAQEASVTSSVNPYVLAYTIGDSDKATWDLTGSQKHLNVSFGHYGAGDPVLDYATGSGLIHRVSRKWQLSSSGTGIDAHVWTGSGVSPVTDTATSRNRGQTLFFRTFVYNARGQLLGSPSINFAVRPSGSEVFDVPNRTLSLDSGGFSGVNAFYTVEPDDPVGGKTLVVSSSTTSSSNQVRSGLTGLGNFAESPSGAFGSDLGAEWVVSSGYTILVHTEKTNVLNAAKDTKFTIGEDVVNVFVKVTDSMGHAVSGVQIFGEQLDNAGVVRQRDSGQSTRGDGWTVAIGFDTRASKGSGWFQTATVIAHSGNSGYGEQEVSMLSAFTANKSTVIAGGPVLLVPNSISGVETAKAGDFPRPGDRIILGMGFTLDGERAAVDENPVPSFCMARFNQSTSRVEILQSGLFWADRTHPQYQNHYFPFKIGIEPYTSGGTDYLQYLAHFGNASQGVTSANGYVTETSGWTPGLIFLTTKFALDSQSFVDDGDMYLIGPSEQHPYSDRALRERKILFDTINGHHHIGTDSRAIGDRGLPG